MEIISVENWRNRKCNIQNKWIGDKIFIDFSDGDKLDMHILIDNRECYINVQNYLDEQIAKDNIANGDIPKPAKEFILTEPIFSLGTTNIFWISNNKMHLYNRIIQQNELNFISTFFDNHNHSIDSSYSASVDSKLYNYLLKSVSEGEVKIEELKNIFNISIDDEKIKELNEMGLKAK
jgi:hypothetical protein